MMSDGNRPAPSYGAAGVNKEEGYRAVEKMKTAVNATHGPQVLGSLGAFASLYAMEGWREPILVAGTDGVGTKLRLALDAGRLDVIGRDCYAMVANDILCLWGEAAVLPRLSGLREARCRRRRRNRFGNGRGLLVRRLRAGGR